MRKKVKIQEIEWLSKEAEEALVLVTDGLYICQAFCQPCTREVGETIEQSLFSFETQGLEVSNKDQNQVSIRRIDSTFRHEIYARVVDLRLEIVEVGNIRFELDIDFSKELTLNCIVKFFCERIDLF